MQKIIPEVSENIIPILTRFKDSARNVSGPKLKKSDKNADKQKSEKAPKEDKLTKVAVSLKKSILKSIKKEAADDDISMNEYIGLALEEKLAKSKGKS